MVDLHLVNRIDSKRSTLFDISRWVQGVFGDHPLAKALRQLEDEYRGGTLTDVAASLARAIRSRYEFIEPPAST